MDKLRSVLIFMAVIGPACSGSITGIATADVAGRTGSCSQTSTTPSAEVSCDLAPFGAATAGFSAGSFSLVTYAYAFQSSTPDTGRAEAFVTASLDQWMIITDGSGTGVLNSYWEGGCGCPSSVSIRQAGVLGNPTAPGHFQVASPFEYGVPFEITATISVSADAIFAGDAFSWTNTLSLTRFDLPATPVPEPGTVTLVLLVLLGMEAVRRRYRFSL